MKNIKKLFLVLFLIGSAFNSFSTVILTENFSGGPATYTTGSHTFSSGNTWDLVSIQGGTEVQFLTNVNASIISPSINSVGTITFKTKESASGGGTFVVSKSVNGGAFTTVDSHIFAGTTFTTYSVTINDVSNNIRIKVSTNAGSSLIIDDFQITDYFIGSALTVSTPALSGFAYIVGFGPSTSTYYNLSGSLLNGAPGTIVVTAPTNYEVSLNDFTFSSSVNVDYSSSTLTSTPIYVRLKAGLPIGSYNSANITNIGGGASNVNVTCSGSVAAVPPPIIEVNPSVLNGFSYTFGSGPSTSQTYNLYGNYLTGYPSNITLTAPSKYEISLDNSLFSTSLLVPYNAPLLNGTPIYVRLKAGVAVGTYNSQNITHTGGGASSKSVTCNGNVTAAPIINLTVSPSNLSGFTYISGSGPSTSQSYNLTGTNLTGFPSSITITAPTHYEVCLTNNGTFTPTVSVSYTSATITSTPIYVRLKAGLAVGTYNSEIVTNAGGGATTVNVTCNGNVTAIPIPTLTAVPASLYGLSYVSGSGPSTAQSFNLSGANLTGFPSAITVTAPTNYEVCLTNNGTFTPTVSVSYTSATITSTPIYVRLKAGLAIGTYNSEIITNAGGGATTVNVTCSGSVTAAPSPLLALSSTSLTGLNYIVGSGPSSVQSYNLSGTYLTGFPSAITVTAPTNYEVCLTNNGTFTPTVSVSYTSATITSTPIYVRLKAGLAIGTYNSETITNAGGGATTVNVTCSGSVTAAPSPLLALSSTSLTGLNYIVGSGPSSVQSYNLSGTYLTGFPSAITVTAPTNYEVCLTNNGTFTPTVSVSYTSATITATPIYVRLKAGLAIGTYNSEIITNAGGGATTVNVTCSGSVTAAPSPLLALSSTSLTGLNYIVGSGPSSVQSYNLSGTYLTGFPSAITVTAPTDYEVCLTNNGTFTPTVSVSYTSATITATPIYVRLKAGLAIGTYNSEIITNAGGGATTVNVTCSGSVTDIPTGPCFSENFSGFTTGTHAVPGTVDLSSTINTYTQTTGWSGIKVFSANGEIKLGSSSASGSVTTPTIDLSSGGSVSFDIQVYGTDAGLVQVFHAPDGVTFTQLGSDITPPANYTTQTIPITGGTTLSKIRIATTQKRVYLDSIRVNCGGSTPTPVITVVQSSLTGFTYVAGAGPSAQQSYTVSGTNLNGSNVTITPSTNYEISQTSGTGFGSTPIVLTSFNGTSTTIYVRLKSGLAVGTYNSEVITNAGGGATTVNLTCSGNVTAAPTPIITVNPTNLTGFTYVAGAGPSAQQSYTVSGTNLNGSNVTITPSTNYEISQTSGTGFGSTSIVLTAFNGTSTTIYVRLKAGLAVGTYNSEIITNAGGGATTVNVTCSGDVTSAPTPIITVNPTSLTGFTYVAGAGPSAQQSYTVSGTNLNGSNVTITPSTNYEISQTSGTGFGSTPIVLTSFNGTSTTIYIRLKAGLAIGTYNSEVITNAGGGATTVNLTCSGSVTAAPTPIITVNPTNLTGFTYVAGAGPSAQQSYSVSGTNLNGSNVTITPSTNYEISQTSGTGFGSTPIVLTSFNGTSTTIYVRLKAGLAVGTYNSEIITNAGGGATTVNVTCSGNVTAAPTPIITVNSTNLTGFTYVAGAGPSAQQSYTVSGTNLNGSNVTITPSTNYEISQTSGTGFGSTPIVLTSFNGTSTTIYVRLKAGLAVGTYNSEIITNAGGGATTVNVTCSGNVADDVSVDEQTSGIWANVFPNPFSETLTIQLLENTNQSYTIQDAIGRIVFSGTSDKASKYVLNTESLAPGLYILKITSEGSEKVAKLMKR